MAEKRNSTATNIDPSLQISSSTSNSGGSDFCLLSEDDIELESSEDRLSVHPAEDIDFSQVFLEPTESSHTCRATTSVEVENMKRKAEEIASSLRKIRSNRTSDADVPSEDYEPPEELKRYRERSLFVAQKLKEDRLLFEESKKRNEAVVDQVKTVKRIHKHLSENTKELRRDDPSADEIMTLRLKIERLEASLSHVQNKLSAKNEVIFENNETIRTLSETVDSTRTAYLKYVEQSQDEIQQLKDEHTKSFEKITNSRDEFCNQLQTVRKKCLLMENDLKLSEFARCRLVSKNAELRERVNQLENELKIPHTKSMSMEDIDEAKSEISLDDQTVAVKDLHPKIECLAMITNELFSYLVSTGNDGSGDPIQVQEDGDFLQNMDVIGDRLESAFFVIRDKLTSLSELQEQAKRSEEKLQKLDQLNEDNKNQETKLKKIIATMKAKIQSETNINKDLSEQLAKAHEFIECLQQASGQDWFARHEELQKSKERELSELQANLSQTIQSLKRELQAKTEESEKLRRTCEQLEDSNDKLENDFVVLQKRDCDDEENWKRLKDENQKLLESMRAMSEKTIEYENERLDLYNRIEYEKQAAADLTQQLEVALAHSDQDNELHLKIENLTYDYAELSRHLEEVSQRLAHESQNTRDLKEQMQFAENTNATLSHEIHDLQKRNQELESAKTLLEANVKQLREHIEYMENEKTHLQQYLEQSNESLLKYEREVKERDGQLEDLRTENEDIAARWEQYQTKISEDEVNVEALKRANEELTSSVRQLRQQAAEMNDEKDQLTQFVQDTTSSLQELETLRTQLHTLHNEREEFEHRMELLENEKRSLESQLHSLQMKVEEGDQAKDESNSQQEFERLRKQMQIREDENEALQSRIRKLEHHKLPLEVEERITSLEQEKNKFSEECEKFKTKYQRLQLYCKANINKAGVADASNPEIGLWKRKYNELKTSATKAEHEISKLKEMIIEYENQAQEREAHLREARTRLEQMQSSQEVGVVVNECIRQTDELRNCINELKDENNKLRDQCEEVEHWQSMMSQLEEELHAARVQYGNVETRLYKMAEEHTDEITKYESLLTEVRTDLNLVQECLTQTNQILRQKDTDFEEYRAQMEAFVDSERARYEQNVAQLQRAGKERVDVAVQAADDSLSVAFEEYRAQVQAERVRYEQTLSQLQQTKKENADIAVQANDESQNAAFEEYRNQMEAFVNSERMRYEQMVAQLQQTRKESVDTAVQTAGLGAEKQPPTLSSYFDFCKDKISSVLQVEEKAADYSNWILPERQDAEYQARYQQVPEFGWQEDEAGLEKSTQVRVDTQSRASQVETSNVDSVTQTVLAADMFSEASQAKPLKRDTITETKQEAYEKEKLSMSQVVNQLRTLFINKMNGDAWAVDDMEWSNEELDMYNENFVDTSFKFVDLFEVIVQYYSSVPHTETVLHKLRNVVGVTQPEVEDGRDHQETYSQLVALTAQLEYENKYLVDAVTFVEDSILARQNVQMVRFHEVLQSWRVGVDLEQSDVIDTLCEEYDIIPNKFAAGNLFTTWKETIVKSLEPPAAVIVSGGDDSVAYANIEPSLVIVMKKNHKLIGDLYYKYNADKNFDPNEFFDQIDDINRDVERLVKFVHGEIAVIEPAGIGELTLHTHGEEHKHEHGHDHDHHDHEHDHHAHEHDHHDHQQQHQHEEHPAPAEVKDDSNTVIELRSLLAESNKKIDSLVRELMEAKSSKDYNEMRQLQAKLDETLYQLHLRDVHVVELTQELTQLLSERDALQLKLSSIIRQYEQLREAFMESNKSEDTSMNSSDLSDKLEELQKVNYMRDPRISETSKQHHAAGMQLFNDDQAEMTQRARNEGSSGFSVPSLFKWITGDIDNKR